MDIIVIINFDNTTLFLFQHGNFERFIATCINQHRETNASFRAP